jgi:hypothetical protein
MSHLGGYQLVEGHGRRGRGALRRPRAQAPHPHVVFPPKPKAVGADLPTAPARCRPSGPARVVRHLSTYTFVLTMFFSVAKVATWWQPIDLVEASPGRDRIAAAHECPAYPPLPTGPESQRLTADLRGDGCEVPVTWDGTTGHFRLDPQADVPEAFQFQDHAVPLAGRLLLGDWDCDGADSPALYLPATGELVSFDRLDDRNGAVRRRAAQTGVQEGEAEVRHRRDGCDVVEIRPAA